MPLFKEILSWMLDIAIVLFLAFIIVYFFGLRTSVVGQAMSGTLENGEQILVNRFAYTLMKPSKDDVVVFLPNGNEKSHYYVRRVVAGPNDEVLIQDGALYVNGNLYNETIDVASMEEAGLAADTIKLGEDEYFVLGDNRNNSEDSRLANIGNVKKEYIIGKAWFHFGGNSGIGKIY